MHAQNIFLPIKRELLECYAFWIGILVLKTCLMIIQVGLSRVFYRAPRNPEDGAPFKAKVITHETVERNRRAHLNDLENIPFFIVISFLYLLTDPSITPTQWIIKIYVISRILYTVSYTVMKSIIRIPIFEIGLFTNIYLSLSVIYHFS
ncbi:microsomal glutathione S-transferase 1-like [Diorhabda sublineata]|uniref:microsomal glutathione S-transferase 1-like n=1 Tax=Diorhabda sublineata TaxID=1163346 RepID=UPI0024E10002|nr:microsomal glutathione S-transferase 1-like [Diorhabda sublineata]